MALHFGFISASFELGDFAPGTERAVFLKRCGWARDHFISLFGQGPNLQESELGSRTAKVTIRSVVIHQT